MNVTLDLRIRSIPTSFLLFVLLLQFLSPAQCQLHNYTQQFQRQRTSALQSGGQMSIRTQSPCSLKSIQVLPLISTAPKQPSLQPHQILRSSFCTWRDNTSPFLLSSCLYSSKLRAVLQCRYITARKSVL